MSQIEIDFQNLLSKKPEIEKCYSDGLVNRRALARYLIQKKIAKPNQLDAVIAMLRRFEFQKRGVNETELEFKISIKDDLKIITLEKDPEMIKELNKLVISTNYELSETLKMIVGTKNITIILDKEKILKLESPILNTYKNISEISLIFSSKAIDSKGVISFISRELALNDIIICEMLTASSELLIYVKDGDVLKAYGLLKKINRH